MFRSETIILNNLYFAKSSMWQTLNTLASLKKIMFVKNPQTQTNSNLSIFSNKMITRCETLFTIIEKIEKMMILHKWPISEYKEKADDYLRKIDFFCEKEKKIKEEDFFSEIEDLILRDYKFLFDNLEGFGNFLKQRVFLLEKFEAMKKIEKLIPLFILKSGNSDGNLDFKKKFFSLLGVLSTEHVFKLRKIFFRISRENIVLRSLNLEFFEDKLVKEYFENEDNKKKEKTLIFVLFPKTEKLIIVNKIKHVLKMFDFYELNIPMVSEKEDFLINFKKDLNENELIIKKTKFQINKILKNFSKPGILPRLSTIQIYKLIIQRELNFSKKLIFIKEKNGFYKLSLWLPKSQNLEITEKLQNIKKSDPHFITPKLEDLQIPEKIEIFENSKIPTKFKIANFSYPFQQIINTYGIPRYKEANPGLFTIITFPFLFGLMFGDIGHGFVLFSVGIFLFLFSKKNSIFEKIKFLILLMGFFAVFCGFVYNEFFSIPFLVFQSCYRVDNFQRVYDGCCYVFGIDWIWGQSVNESAFVNSFKMKFSIVVGVIHMLFGIFLKILNSVYFENFVDLFFEAIPQFVFLSVTFGYMVICIVIKWLTDWEGRDSISIIQIFINFTSVKEPLFGGLTTQQNLHTGILIIAFFSIILMLVPKPIILYIKSKKGSNSSNSTEYLHTSNENSLEIPNKNKKKKKSSEKLDISIYLENTKTGETSENPNFSEHLIHQLIETIEFVLGSVSNTASYLRLWALSLAHGQLSRVFYEMIFGWSIEKSENMFLSFFVIVFGFVFFFFVSFAVIMCMDFMECFLHALRLHWVEFQGKFFKGDGVRFQTFKHRFK